IEQPAGFAAHELVGQSSKNPGPIAGVLFAAAGAAMIHAEKGFCSVADNAMAAHALDVGNKAYAAAILFEGRVVEAALLGQTIFKFDCHANTALLASYRLLFHFAWKRMQAATIREPRMLLPRMIPAASERRLRKRVPPRRLPA